MSQAPQTHDLSAESALLGLLLHRPAEVLPELRARLAPRDFFSRQHAALYQAVLDLDQAGQPIEINEVFHRLEQRGDHGISEQELEQLKGYFQAAPPAAPAPGAMTPPHLDAESLLQRVLARSRSRELVRRLELLLQEARRAPEDLKRHLDLALGTLLPLAHELGRHEDAGLQAVHERLKRSKGRRSTGWPLVDSQELWFSDGELAVVLGRTGHGKTNFLLNLAKNWLEQKGDAPILFYSLEMTDEQLAKRLLAMRGAGPSAGSGEAWGQRLQLRFTPRMDVERLAADALRRMAGRKGGAVFVDSLTALGPPPQARTHGRRDLEVAEVCRRLKELAVLLDCPVVASVPAKRENLAESATPLRELLARGTMFNAPEVEDAIRWRRPRLEHLPEPGLEAHADVVLAILNFVADYQEELDPEHRQVFQAQPSGPIEIAALKHRGGALTGVELRMDMKTGLIAQP